MPQAINKTDQVQIMSTDKRPYTLYHNADESIQVHPGCEKGMLRPCYALHEVVGELVQTP